MEETIEKYISENKMINIRLINNQNSKIQPAHILFYYLTLENDDIFKKIILSGKPISVEFCQELHSYKNIDILQYAKKISIYNYCNKTSKNVIDILNKSVNLQKLRIQSYYISKIIVINKLSEKEFLKYIKIIFVNDVNPDDVNKIAEIKSLDVLHLSEYEYTNCIESEKIFQIFHYIVNNLKKNIKIVLDWYVENDEFRKVISLITYNFKINEFDYVFTYISPAFRKFDNLYDFNLYYQ